MNNIFNANYLNPHYHDLFLNDFLYNILRIKQQRQKLYNLNILSDVYIGREKP